VKRSGKGDYCRKAQNHLEKCLLEGQKFAFRAGNSAPRAGISAPGQNFRGPEIQDFWGPEIQDFRPFEIRLSPLQDVVVQRSVKGPEILVWQNFQGPEIP
jgi:hypothetical protein